MNTRLSLFLVLLLASCARLSSAESLLWYREPAKIWNEALPVGNGRLGAMVFGGTSQERIQFNEATIWTGKPHDYLREGAGALLPRLRELVLSGKAREAEQLARPGFLSDPIRQKAYQPCGDLLLTLPGHEQVSEFRRELDLDAAVARTSYTVNGVRFTREVFASYPDQVLVVRLSADRPGSLSFTAKLSSPHKNSSVDVTKLPLSTNDSVSALRLKGAVSEGAIRFEASAVLRHSGGRLRTEADALVVENADSATLLVNAGTNFVSFQDVTGNPSERCQPPLRAALAQGDDALALRHRVDHQTLYRRVSFDLPSGANASLATDARVKAIRAGGLEQDPSFPVLHFNFGRYLLIASSRPGGQPANLQGIWNELLNPPWESKMTTNINFEMNYWPAELTNLAECHEPLFDLVDDLMISGARSAQHYWNSRGWVVHHNTDLWRGAAPINNIDGIWPTGGAWLCQHLWEHYLFSGNTHFLEKRALPALKQASLFFLDSLVTEPKTGYLVTCPSFSPELSNPEGGLCAGPTMDIQLIRALFDSTLEAARILGDKDPLLAQITEARAKLPPHLIGRHGQLQEWLEDHDRPNDNHRHMSPLWALYPGNELTPDKPEPYAAAKLLLRWRGDGSTGWSFAWRVPLWARVGDGNMAFRQASLLYAKKTLPNLFDLCGPFQIDGNFGTTAGLAEMLLQSHRIEASTGQRIIDLLPALPQAWPAGSIRGLRARGGLKIDLSWAKGALKSATLTADQPGTFVVQYGGQTRTVTLSANEQVSW